MIEIAGEYLGELVSLVNEMSPYLLLGFLAAGLLRVVFPRGIVARYMGQRNFKSVFNASLLGVPMPLCSCGVLPAGIGCGGVSWDFESQISNFRFQNEWGGFLFF